MRANCFFRSALIKPLIFWLGVLALSFIVMVQSVHAQGTINLPASIPSPTITIAANQTSTMRLFPQLSCEAYVAGLGSAYDSPVATSSINCRFRTISTGGFLNDAMTTQAHNVYCMSQYFQYHGYGAGYHQPQSGNTTTCLLSDSAAAAPQNSSCTGTVCTCNTGYQPNAAGTACVLPSCPAGTVVSAGFFDIGQDPSYNNGAPVLMACKNGCSISYSGGSVGFRRQVNGVFHYYAKGEYSQTGSVCNGEPELVAAALTTLGPASCAAGQSSITMNGVTKCLDSTGSPVNGNSSSAVQAAKTLSDQKAQDAIQAAKDAAIAAGMSASAVEAAGAAAAAVVGGSDSTQKDPVLDAFCKDNPESPICVGQDFGEVSDVDLTNKDVNVSIVPVLDGALGQAGSCPAPRAISLGGQTRYFDYATFCNFSNGIRPVILAFAWLLAAGILVGGFKAA